MVPIENSVEGGVSATLDALASGEPLVVTGEVLVPITFVLAAAPGMPLADVRAVGTHSHAWAWSAAGWVRTSPGRPTSRPCPRRPPPRGCARPATRHTSAAVCAPVAAQNHGLEVLARDIGDNGAAVTRFVLVARPGDLPERTGADKTTLVLFQRDDHAGGLLELLEQFAVRGINMSRLESRPTKDSMGSYCFSIDIEGHVLDERVGEALVGLKRARTCGSSAATRRPTVRRCTSVRTRPTSRSRRRVPGCAACAACPGCRGRADVRPRSRRGRRR